MIGARHAGPGLGLPVAASVALHAALAAGFLMLRAAPSLSPPIYRVTMIAAAPGERTVGVVQQPGSPVAPRPPAKQPPVRSKVAPPPAPPAPAATTKPTPLPEPVTKAATPMPPSAVVPDSAPKAATPPPTAGGGPAGGRGADVANVNTSGIEFPFPGYLENIVRQIALRFKPSSRGALRAEVSFLIRRDGTVPASSIRLSKRSNVYTFDLEAQGAVEAAANAHAFGPLPAGFTEDVLPVTFRFDPQVLR